MEQCYNRITGSNDAKIQYNIGTKEIDVAYTDAQGMRMRIPLNQLSDGYKSTISLVADIAYRMAVLPGAWASRSGHFTGFCGTVCKPG